MNLATRCLPALSVIAAFTIPAVLLRPGKAPELQHTICLDLPVSQPPPSELRMSRPGIEACLAAWDERGRGDAFVTVHVRIDAEGRARAATFDGPDEDALGRCIEAAVTFPVYPPGEPREVDVYVEWFARWLVLSVELAHHHASVEQALDDETYGPRHLRPRELEAARAQLRLLKQQHAKLLREIELRRRR